MKRTRIAVIVALTILTGLYAYYGIPFLMFCAAVGAMLNGDELSDARNAAVLFLGTTSLLLAAIWGIGLFLTRCKAAMTSL